LVAEAGFVVVAAAPASVGFRKFRLTGGEPTLRADLVEIVERLAAIESVQDLSMTTNGILLPELAVRLRAAGLRRVNIHIDTLNSDRLKRLMRFAGYEQIWAGLEAAVAAGLAPIKINCVVTRDYNDQDVVDLARLALDHDWHVRFIELMPLGGGETARLALSQFVPTAETRGRIEAELGPLVLEPSLNPSDEARNFRLAGGRGVIGFISPVSEPYCGTCNRMRLTADGKFHLCLLNDDELDVRAALRNGLGPRAVEDTLRKAIMAKPAGHHLEEGVSVERRAMFQIGG
jgi:GTP 3',8-cyclase